MLKSLGINTIGDFANYENDMLLKRKLGKAYYTLMDWAHGNDESEVNKTLFICLPCGMFAAFYCISGKS